jgi:hypothetical protein
MMRKPKTAPLPLPLKRKEKRRNVTRPVAARAVSAPGDMEVAAVVVGASPVAHGMVIVAEARSLLSLPAR